MGSGTTKKRHKVSTKPPSGTRDFLPADIGRRMYVIDRVREVYERYGFVPLETPTIENLTTLLGKYGDEGDQLLYRVLHRRDNLSRALALDPVTEADLADQGLRYDLTVPLARVVGNTSYNLPKYFKRYQIQPVWRADRPGRGRFREFYQCDVDITGTTSLVAEAEVCAAVAEVLVTLGFSDFTININHREVLRAMIRAAGIDAALEGSALVAVDKLDKIGEDGVKKELAERGVSEESAATLLSLVLTGSAEGRLVGLEDGVALLRTKLDDEGGAALDALAQLGLLLSETPAAAYVRFAPELARGLSYYTGAIFEITVKDLQGSLGGGGRYDGLIGMFDPKGKKQVPSVGFSLGLERILVVMEERGMFKADEIRVGPDVLLCWMGVDLASIVGVAHRLRAQGLRVEVFPEKAKLGKQLGYADSDGVNAPVAAILGEDELAAGELTLKHLKSGEQSRVKVAETLSVITGWRAKA